MEIKRKCAPTNREDRGQMTIEFVVAFPAALIIGLIVINALLFFSECASFDRSFRSLVCTYAPSPSYEQEIGQTCALISEFQENSLPSKASLILLPRFLERESCQACLEFRSRL